MEDRRGTALSLLLSSVIIIVSEFNPRSFSTISRIPGDVTPGGVKRNDGKARSTIAMGPCSRSAAENRSATT